MFDIGWSEMAVIALLTLVVIGPKELPRVMRTVGQWVRKAQSLAREFQRGLDDMAREADLEDAKKLIDTGRSIANPKKMVMDSLDSTDSVSEEFRDLQKAMQSDAPGGGPANEADGADSEDGAGDGAGERPVSAVASDAKVPEAKAPKASAGDDETVKATIVKTPTNIAPPHSITPPPDSVEPGKEGAKAEAAAKPRSAAQPPAQPPAESAAAAKPKAAPKPKSKAKPAVKAEPASKAKTRAKPKAKAPAATATAGSDGSQKTA